MVTTLPFPRNCFDEINLDEFSEQNLALELSAVVAVTDGNGIIKYVNNNFCELSGYSREELIGKSHSIVNSGYHPPTFFKKLWDTIQNGKIWKGEIRNKNKNTNFYWEDITIVPFMDKTQKPIQYLSISHDITALKESQKISNNQQMSLAVASKFSALEELAANLSHEINNPLGVILGRCEMLMNHLGANSPDPEHINKMVEHIEFTARRIEQIIKSMRSFSSPTDGDPFEPVALAKLVQVTIDFVQQRFKDHGITLITPPIDLTLMIECRSTEISQIILNLLNNAFDAVQKIEIKWVKIEVQEYKDRIEISVIDSGEGILAHHQEKLFDPFFSTKEKQYGTGLGLSISKGFAERHNALLEYDALSKNTRFHLSIPKKKIAHTF